MNETVEKMEGFYQPDSRSGGVGLIQNQCGYTRSLLQWAGATFGGAIADDDWGALSGKGKVSRD